MLSSVNDVKDLNIKVELLDKFDDVPEATNTELQKDVSAYIISRQIILINNQFFFEYPFKFQCIILIHEIGHAYYHLYKPTFLMDKKFDELNEDHRIDFLLCCWGFEKQLIEERKNSYDKSYCKVLQLWSDKDAYITAMKNYWLLKLAGIDG